MYKFNNILAIADITAKLKLMCLYRQINNMVIWDINWYFSKGPVIMARGGGPEEKMGG